LKNLTDTGKISADYLPLGRHILALNMLKEAGDGYLSIPIAVLKNRNFANSANVRKNG